jgi:hypothetical protein
MFSVNGPEYISIFKHQKKRILLFGDEHFSTSGLCQDCHLKNDCLHIKDFIDHMKEQSKVDLFLEAPYTTQDVKHLREAIMGKLTNMKADDVLGSVVSHFHNQLYKKHRKQQSLRVHYSDFRFHSSLDLLKQVSQILQKNIEAKIVYPLVVLSHFKTPKIFKAFADACIIKDNFIDAIHGIFQKNAYLYADKDHLTSFNEPSISMHRIRKQIRKTSPKMQNALIKFHNKQCRKIMTDQYNSHYKTQRKHFLKAQSFDIENIQILFMTINNWLFHLMDMYLLARMVCYIEQNKKTNIVVFTGTNHIINYETFLESCKEFTKEWECNKAWNLSQTEQMLKRCIQIPKNIVTNLIKI